MAATADLVTESRGTESPARVRILRCFRGSLEPQPLKKFAVLHDQTLFLPSVVFPLSLKGG